MGRKTKNQDTTLIQIDMPKDIRDEITIAFIREKKHWKVILLDWIKAGFNDYKLSKAA